MLLEDTIIKFLKFHGLLIEGTNETWIHEYIPWLSCTVDGLIYNNHKVVAVVETKIYKSIDQFNSTVKVTNGKPTLNKKSRAYYQLQSTIEIVNDSFGIFVFEHNLRIDFIVFKRDFVFLRDMYDKLLHVYLRYLVPYNIYYDRNPKSNAKSKLRSAYFSDYIYNRLFNLLVKYENINPIFEKARSQYMR